MSSFLLTRMHSLPLSFSQPHATHPQQWLRANPSKAAAASSSSTSATIMSLISSIFPKPPPGSPSTAVNLADVGNLVLIAGASAASVAALVYLVRFLRRRFPSPLRSITDALGITSKQSRSSSYNHHHHSHHSHHHQQQHHHQSSSSPYQSAYNARRATQRARERAHRFARYTAEVKQLTKHGVHIIDADTFYHKKEKMNAAGLAKLQMVLDFDRTVTKLKCSNGSTGLTSYGIIENASYMYSPAPSPTASPSFTFSTSSSSSSALNSSSTMASSVPPTPTPLNLLTGTAATPTFSSVPIFTAAHRARLHSLFTHYYPLEKSTSLPLAQRLQHAAAWWQATHRLLVDTQLTRRQLNGAVFSACQNGSIELRAYFDTLCAFLHQHDVPLIVLSAGLSDCIELTLRLHNINADKNDPSSNIHIFANQMKFAKPTAQPQQQQHNVPAAATISASSAALLLQQQYLHHQQQVQQQLQYEEVLVGFDDMLIHSLNKNYEHVVKSSMYPLTKDRTSVILIGDGVDDLTMLEGIINMDECITIGFINDKFQEKFHDFASAYDVVVNGEMMGMEFVMSLVYGIGGGSESLLPQSLSSATAHSADGLLHDHDDDADKHRHTLRPQFQVAK